MNSSLGMNTLIEMIASLDCTIKSLEALEDSRGRDVKLLEAKLVRWDLWQDIEDIITYGEIRGKL